MKCYICGYAKLTEFLNLGNQAPSDAFVESKNIAKPQRRYPLNLVWCPKCFLVQLGFSVDPKELFSKYVYTTGSNNSLREHFKALAETLVKKFNLGSNDLVIDVGCNDGTFLKSFLPGKVKILGIDPSSVAATAKKFGLPVEVDFFNNQVAARVTKRYGHAKIITASNVFAHVPALNSFVKGVKKLLTADGVFVSESHYLIDIVKKIQYDSVYHEHLRYYSLFSLKKLFARHDLEIFDCERLPMHNGSIRVYAARPGVYQQSARVKKLLALEKSTKVNTLPELKKFAQKVQVHSQVLLKMITGLKQSGNTIVGIGAPAKGNTLLQACRLGPELIDYLAEKSELKIGLYSPGMKIPVLPDAMVTKEQPDYAIILSWNIAEELTKKLKTAGYKGKFIVPFPKPKII